MVMNVDDDSMVQMISEIIMSDESFCESIVKLEDGKKALEYFEQQSKLPIEEQKIPELVFLDINMPIMDGWEFLTEFRKVNIDTYKKIPIYIVSSSIANEDFEKSKTFPEILDYLSKPVELETLVSILNF